jgi:hypothetical protein
MNTPKVAAILADRAGSYWLKAALRGALDRDPVDAWADAARLAEALDEWCAAKLAEPAGRRPDLRKASGSPADEVG